MTILEESMAVERQYSSGVVAESVYLETEKLKIVWAFENQPPPQEHTSSNKTTSPKPFQSVSSAKDHVCKLTSPCDFKQSHNSVMILGRDWVEPIVEFWWMRLNSKISGEPWAWYKWWTPFSQQGSLSTWSGYPRSCKEHHIALRKITGLTFSPGKNLGIPGETQPLLIRCLGVLTF